MKVQCSCGTKHEFDVTPEMARTPVRFVCSNCGLDFSDFLNDLIQKELASQAATGAPSVAEPAATPAPRMRVAHAADPPTQPAPAAPAAPAQPMPSCSKHPGQRTVERCAVCQKPICPQCMELFGYVCSPACRARATAHGLDVPVFEGQRQVIEARRWRRLGWIGAALGTALVALLGVWIWYAWSGSIPRPVFSVRFPEKAFSGMIRLSGEDQLVFLRSGRVARYDLKTKQEIWSRDLLDRAQIERAVDRQIKALQAVIDKANAEDPDNAPKMPPRSKWIDDFTRDAEAAMQLMVKGQNVWLLTPDRLLHLDWASGRSLQDIPRAAGFERESGQGDELIFTGLDAGQPVVTHLNLATGERTTEPVGGAVLPDATPAVADSPAGAGLPIGRVGSDRGRVLDPDKVASQAQNLSLPARIALPAVLANQANQERALAEMRDHSKTQSLTAVRAPISDQVQLFPSPYGNVELTVRLLRENLVSRSAMKAPPQRSALSGDLTVSKTADVANEILNQQQRDHGGDMVVEDKSLYQVKVHLPGANSPADWTGEVTGAPAVFPLRSVTVLAAGTTVLVLDKRNQKLWQSELSYKIPDAGHSDSGDSPFGEGPCVERGDTLYIFDEAVLTAFDLATGNARWRLPSVGVVGLFFDDQGKLYVNTTTASPDKIRYSRQIDITEKIRAVIYKLDAKTGQVVWNADAGGFLTYLSGKFLYTMQSFDPGDEGDDNDLTEILRKPAYLHIRRIDPANGHTVWEHSQERAPLDVRFDRNQIELLFKKEVQVLRFLSW